MGSERRRNASVTAVSGVVGAGVAGVVLGRTNVWLGVGAALVLLGGVALMLYLICRTGPHTPWAQARPLVAPGHAVVLWKPTCGYCERLLRAVGRHPQVTWVNVWTDPDANRAVRDLNDGDELTPTAIVGDAVLRNPTAAELRAALTQDRPPPRPEPRR